MLCWLVGFIEDEVNVDEINDVVCWLVGFIVDVDDDAGVVKTVEYDVVNDNVVDEMAIEDVVECCVDDNSVDGYAVEYGVVDDTGEVVVDKENVVEYDVANDIAEVVANVVVDVVVGGRVATMPSSIKYWIKFK